MQSENVAVKLLHCNIKFSSGCTKDLTNVRKANMQLYTNNYICTYTHTYTADYICFLQAHGKLSVYIYICPYVMRTPQRMNLKHQNVLELLGVTQGNITCLVMPSVQRRSIQVCMWLSGSIIKVHTYLHFVVTIAFSVPLPLSLGHPQFTVCVATWSRILHVKRNLWGWWLHMYFMLYMYAR